MMVAAEAHRRSCLNIKNAAKKLGACGADRLGGQVNNTNLLLSSAGAEYIYNKHQWERL